MSEQTPAEIFAEWFRAEPEPVQQQQQTEAPPERVAAFDPSQGHGSGLENDPAFKRAAALKEFIGILEDRIGPTAFDR